MRIKAFYKTILILLIFGLLGGCNSNGSNAYVPESSGNINAITVVMPQALWSKSLGMDVRSILMEPYEGLPFDEPKYDLYHLDPSIFTGFARSGRNIVFFKKDTSNQGFRLIKNLWARPQIAGLITGEDEEVMKFYFEIGRAHV